MNLDTLPTTREFKSRHMVTVVAVSVGTIGFISTYLAALLNLGAAEWGYFARVVAVLLPILLVGVRAVNNRMLAPLLAFLDAAREGEEVDGEIVRSAFRSASTLPYKSFFAEIGWWSAGGACVAVGMRLGHSGLANSVYTIIFLAAFSGGFIASTFNYFVNKRFLAAILEALADEIGESEHRRDLSTRVTLQAKLMLSVTGVTLVVVVFAMLLAVVRSGEPLERNATRSQLAYLDEIGGPIAVGAEALSAAAERARRLQIAQDVLLLDAEAGGSVARDDRLSDVELALIRARPRGESSGIDSPHAFSWTTLPARAGILVAVSDWESIRADSGSTALIFVMVAAIAGAISLALAIFLSNDVAARVERLRAAAASLAAGDLRESSLPEAEDELGELTWSFEAMSAALLNIVTRIDETATLVETATGEIAPIVHRVAEGAENQNAGVGAAVSSMEGISRQIAGIATAAQELNVLVEEASSSILEMGAAGDELNDTAGVLSSRVEEVSTSIEQMVRSVKEVGTHTAALSEAANETSSSMEEMASAMRQMDVTADTAAKLSGQVVEAAEGGRATVQETMRGMESIQEATARAESVIAGLGSRAKEIGSILDVIDDVADETNLLALNAAIIAAQAGEHGRAFSVVADEIKELADRVLASTKEISELIRAVQDESANAVSAIAEGARSVAAGVDLASQAGDALEVITRSSRESGGFIHEIVLSVQEQSKAANHVATMMERVNDGVEAIHRAGEEQDRGNEVVFRSTVAMREVAQQLRATTQEQASGGNRIRESIDGVRDAVESIHAALQVQGSACAEVTGFLEEVSASSQSNSTSSTRLSEAIEALLRHAQGLRVDMEKFKLVR